MSFMTRDPPLTNEESNSEQDGMILADHKRRREQVRRLPEQSEAQMNSVAEVDSPSGWRRAIEEVFAKPEPQESRAETNFWVGASAIMAASLLVSILLLLFIAR
jgi:hypothetical protein